jgi:hypothetical protein
MAVQVRGPTGRLCAPWTHRIEHPCYEVEGLVRVGYIPLCLASLPFAEQVGQAVAAVGEHHCEVAHNPARIVPAGRSRVGASARQADPVGRVRQQRRPGVRHQSVSIRHNIYGEPAPIALHPQGDPPESVLRASIPRRILRRTVKRPRPSGPLLRHARSRLGRRAPAVTSRSPRRRRCRRRSSRLRLRER